MEHTETIFEHTQDALFLVEVSSDGTFTIQTVNRAYEELTGLSREGLQGETPRTLLGEEQGAAVEARYQECVTEQAPIEYDEQLTLGGETSYWHTRLTPVVEDGTVVQLVGATRDITERREREQKRELIETLFEHAQECQFIVDVADGAFKLRHANNYYKRTVGLSPAEPATGQTPTELFGETGGREILDRYRECIETRESVTYTVEVPVPEEGTVYRTILVPVVTDDKVTHIVGTARDVTDHKRREEKLERQNERLDDFATVVSHDLRGPLRVADGRLELIRDECESDHIDDVAQALDRMDALIEDLLTLAREGDDVSDVEPVALAGLLERCWQNIGAPEATIVIDTDLTIRADRSRLQQLLENLLRNAVEHGGVDVTVTIGEVETGFYVEDDGPGIPVEEREDIFEAGYTTAFKGTGFGLRIARQVAEAHGFDIRVTDGEQGGARFEVTGVEIIE